MSEAELEIARNLGASSFLVYSFIKNFPDGSATDIEVSTGLSRGCIDQTLKKLSDTNILNKRKSNYGSPRVYLYTTNKGLTNDEQTNYN
jgi:DNA-binding MarR family transcriptional regulator